MTDPGRISTLYRGRVCLALDHLDFDMVTVLAEMIWKARDLGHMVYVIGNGGSASTAEHIALDLARNAGDPVRAIALTNIGTLTATANDDGYDSAFDAQVSTYGVQGDLLIALSGSGNSINILTAVARARRMHMATFALLGFDGGAAKNAANYSLVVPSNHYGVIEDVHLMVGHMVTEILKGENL